MMLKIIVIFTAAFTMSMILTRAIVIGLAISSVASVMYWISAKRNVSKKSWELFSVVPEIIDHLTSGIQSGLSLNEAISNLSQRGPELTQEYFNHFKENLNAGLTFESAISRLQESFNIRASDQLFESLIFAKSLGGSELLSMLRQLGDFTRQDLTLRREIAAKQGWIRNSAHLSAAAPWILLLLLSVQPSTSQTFSSPQGISILVFGIAMTAIAYLWMGKLSEMPQPKRIFGVNS